MPIIPCQSFCPCCQKWGWSFNLWRKLGDETLYLCDVCVSFPTFSEEQLLRIGFFYGFATAKCAVQSTVNPIKPSFVTPYPEESFTISDIQHLYLVDSGPNKINCIKVIRKLLRNELAEAVQMMEQASPKKPVLILEDVDATNIETAKQEFEAVGCKVEIK